MPATAADIDARLMRRAISLAMRGRGGVEPNPMVGCVIVSAAGRVIGEGFHQVFGGPHAEPQAIASCTQSPRGGTAYVTLEPCCHTDKKTPPCVPAVIAAGLARVVVGCTDPNPPVAGRGVGLLREAGIGVDEGVLGPQCRQLIAPFTARIVQRRPYVTLKWAQSADGKVAGAGGRRVQISNESSQRLVHELRARSDAIMVGVGTVMCDDPQLTARGVARMRPLLRVVVDTHLRMPPTARVLDNGGAVVFCSRQAPAERWAAIEQRGAQVVRLPVDTDGRLPLDAVLAELHRRQVMHLLVESGPALARVFVSANLADRAWVFRSPRVLGEAGAPSAIAMDWPAVASVDVAGDTLIEYLNPASAVYCCAEASADIAKVLG